MSPEERRKQLLSRYQSGARSHTTIEREPRSILPVLTVAVLLLALVAGVFDWLTERSADSTSTTLSDELNTADVVPDNISEAESPATRPAEPDGTAKAKTDSDVPRPDVPVPDVSGPDVSGPDVSGPDVSGSDVSGSRVPGGLPPARGQELVAERPPEKASDVADRRPAARSDSSTSGLVAGQQPSTLPASTRAPGVSLAPTPAAVATAPAAVAVTRATPAPAASPISPEPVIAVPPADDRAAPVDASGRRVQSKPDSARPPRPHQSEGVALLSERAADALGSARSGRAQREPESQQSQAPQPQGQPPQTPQLQSQQPQALQPLTPDLATRTVEFVEQAPLPDSLRLLLDAASDGRFDVPALKAFSKKWPQATTALGLEALSGTPDVNDYRRAFSLFKKASKSGDVNAMFQMGLMHLRGLGIEARTTEAMAWFIVAASHGHLEAMQRRDSGLAAMSEKERGAAISRASHVDADPAAGWSLDPTTKTAVWLPSWYRTGAYTLTVKTPAKDGRAHGRGEILLEASHPGSADRIFKGAFENGYFFGDSKPRSKLHFLSSDRFLFQLPPTTDPSIARGKVWIGVEFGVNFAADPCFRATNRTNVLIVSTPTDFPALDDSAVKQAMQAAWNSLQSVCPETEHVKATVVPEGFHTGTDRFGHLTYETRLATADLLSAAGDSPRYGNFENHAARAAAAQARNAAAARKKAERAAARRKAAEAAATRGNPDVRGLRIGMTRAEVLAHFSGQIAQADPPASGRPRQSDYTQPRLRLTLTDGSAISVSFTSKFGGEKLTALRYEQNLRGGPDEQTIKSELEAKYGKPDTYGSGGNWWQYQLLSAAGDGPVGAFMKVHYRVDKTSDAVTYLRLTMNDTGLARLDKRAAAAAARSAKRKLHEKSKSQTARF